MYSLVVIGWLEEFFSLNVVVTESPERGLALENVIPWVSVKLGRTDEGGAITSTGVRSYRILSFRPRPTAIKSPANSCSIQSFLARQKLFVVIIYSAWR